MAREPSQSCSRAAIQQSFPAEPQRPGSLDDLPSETTCVLTAHTAYDLPGGSGIPDRMSLSSLPKHRLRTEDVIMLMFLRELK